MSPPVRRLGPPALAAALAAALVAGPAAGAPRIVPGQRIGPVAIGAERSPVEAAIGPGVVIARTPSGRAPRNRNLDRVRVAYPAWGVVATFATDEASAVVRAVSTRSPRYRTRDGLGVGSTRAAVRAAHPRARCSASACRIGPGAPGAVTTRLVLVAGRVARVELVRPPSRP